MRNLFLPRLGRAGLVRILDAPLVRELADGLAKKIKPLARQRGDEDSLRPAVGMTHDFRLKHGVVDLVVNEYRRNVVCLDVLEHRVHLADLVLAHG